MSNDNKNNNNCCTAREVELPPGICKSRVKAAPFRRFDRSLALGLYRTDKNNHRTESGTTFTPSEAQRATLANRHDLEVNKKRNTVVEIYEAEIVPEWLSVRIEKIEGEANYRIYLVIRGLDTEAANFFADDKEVSLEVNLVLFKAMFSIYPEEKELKWGCTWCERDFKKDFWSWKCKDYSGVIAKELIKN